MPPESPQWFYVVGPGARTGPIDPVSLQDLLAADQIPATALVWREGLPDWIPAFRSELWPIGKIWPVPAPYAAPNPLGADSTGGLIPYNNKDALTAYYIGLFALIPVLGLAMGPTALILGRKGLAFARQNPAVKGHAHAWIGIVLGGLWTVVHWGALIVMAISLLNAR